VRRGRRVCRECDRTRGPVRECVELELPSRLEVGVRTVVEDPEVDVGEMLPAPAPSRKEVGGISAWVLWKSCGGLLMDCWVAAWWRPREWKGRRKDAGAGRLGFEERFNALWRRDRDEM
jgi:hypothetical protein